MLSKIRTMTTKNPKKIPPFFCCQLCDYITSYKKDYIKHCETNKHKINNINKRSTQHSLPHICCHCNKVYKERTGLWRHKQKCTPPDPELERTDADRERTDAYRERTDADRDRTDQLIEQLIQQNANIAQDNMDIKHMILEIVKKGTNVITNTMNSHNKSSFNLNFFLNETCKNAMNMSDFVNSIQLQLSDLTDVGKLGYVKGISKIILNHLNNLDETVRPIHCTDQKRETIYVKDQDQWTKEDEPKTKLKKWINVIADKNIRLLPKFREKYPDYNNSSSKQSDIYDKLVIEVMDTDPSHKDQIIKHLSRATIIQK